MTQSDLLKQLALFDAKFRIDVDCCAASINHFDHVIASLQLLVAILLVRCHQSQQFLSVGVANDDRSICSSPPVSDEIGARALFSRLPNVEWRLGNWGHNADWFREALEDKGIRACVPGRKQRKKAVRYDQRRHKRRVRIEIMFGRLRDWRRVTARYDRCPKLFLSAIALAATAIFWLSVLTVARAAHEFLEV